MADLFEIHIHYGGVIQLSYRNCFIIHDGWSKFFCLPFTFFSFCLSTLNIIVLVLNLTLKIYRLNPYAYAFTFYYPKPHRKPPRKPREKYHDWALTGTMSRHRKEPLPSYDMSHSYALWLTMTIEDISQTVMSRVVRSIIFRSAIYFKCQGKFREL